MSSSHPAIHGAPALPGEILADKYRVERVLGMGGMGVVVAARNIALGKRVAIKMMLAGTESTPKAVERFEREARAVVQLQSEHVAGVLDFGKLPSGAPYIVMELLEGADLEALSRERTFAVGEAVDYVLQACEAVAEAHRVGIIHRDLKPRNLFLTRRRDGTPLVKVLDFGISKWTPPGVPVHSLTRTSDVIGSPSYMSPEQIRSAKDVDARTDVWSLGVILFELLAGRLPFLADSLPQLCARVLEQDAPRLSTLRADVPAELDDVIARCLARDPDRRFQTIAELATALAPLARRSAGPSPEAPRAGSSARVHVSNGTSVSWAETILDGVRSRKPRRSIVVVALPVLALGALSFAWLGSRAPRGSIADATADAAPPPPVSIEPTATATATATPAPAPLPTLSASTSAAPPPRPALRTRPAVASASTPASSAPPAPGRAPAPSATEDVFTPADRK